MSLAPEHVAKLGESGITAAFAETHGVRSLSAAEANQHLRRSDIPCGGILFPHPGAEPYCNVRLDTPLPDPDRPGKYLRYLGPSGVPVRLYILPEVAAQLSRTPGTKVIPTEGCKKALSLVIEGFAAISIPGVSCWGIPRSEEEKKSKVERRIHKDLEALSIAQHLPHIMFDDDVLRKAEVAREEWEFARALERAGARVRIVRVPTAPDGRKRGIDDWLGILPKEERRPFVEQLLAAARPPCYFGRDGKPAILPIAEFVADMPPRKFMVEGLVPEGCIIMLVGPAKLGKTALVVHIAIAVASGGTVLGAYSVPSPRRVLLVDVDQSRFESAERLRRAIRSLPREAIDRIDRWHLPGLSLASTEDLARVAAWVRAAIDETEMAPLVCIDTLRSVTPSGPKENESEMGVLISGLRPIADLGADVLLVHHAGHATIAREDSAAARGSSAITAAVDDVWVARPVKGGKGIRLSFDARRTGAPAEPIVLSLNFDDFTVAAEDAREREAKDNRARVSTALGDEPRTVRDIAEEVGIPRSTVGEHLQELVSNGLAGKADGGGFVRCPASGSPKGESRTDSRKGGPNGSATSEDSRPDDVSSGLSGGSASGHPSGQHHAQQLQGLTTSCPVEHTHRETTPRTGPRLLPETDSNPPAKGQPRRSRRPSSPLLFDPPVDTPPLGANGLDQRRPDSEPDAPASPGSEGIVEEPSPASVPLIGTFVPRPEDIIPPRGSSPRIRRERV